MTGLFETGKALIACLLVFAASLAGHAAFGSPDNRYELAPGLFADNVVLKRQGSRSVRLQFTLVNESDRDVSLRALGIFSAFNDMRDVSLVDFEAGIRYGVVADTDGNYLGSHGPDVIPARSSQSYWTQFSAPPLTTRTLTISFHNAMPIDDVTLQP